MAGSDSRKGEGVPNDLAKTLANHDAAINNLSGRMTGVENGLTALSGDLNKGFSELGSKLVAMEAAKPPSLYIQVRMVAAGIGIFAMAASGIGFLIHAYMAPQVLQVATKADVNSKDVERRQADDIAELKAYRQQDRESIKSTLADQQKQIDSLRRSFWVGSTSVASKKGTP
jgi:hypothetical protein